jgi:hypothetical protein
MPLRYSHEAAVLAAFAAAPVWIRRVGGALGSLELVRYTPRPAPPGFTPARAREAALRLERRGLLVRERGRWRRV